MKTHLLVKVSIGNREQFLRQEHLQFLDEQIFRIVNANERADDVAWFIRAEFFE